MTMHGLILITVASHGKHRFPSVLRRVHVCGCQRGVHSGSIGSWGMLAFLYIISYKKINNIIIIYNNNIAIPINNTKII